MAVPKTEKLNPENPRLFEAAIVVDESDTSRQVKPYATHQRYSD